MKYLISTLFLALVFLSWGSKKEKIVSMQKKLEDSIQKVNGLLNIYEKFLSKQHVFDHKDSAFSCNFDSLILDSQVKLEMLVKRKTFLLKQYDSLDSEITK